MPGRRRQAAPAQPGEIACACGMNMLHGMIVVQWAGGRMPAGANIRNAGAFSVRRLHDGLETAEPARVYSPRAIGPSRLSPRRYSMNGVFLWLEATPVSVWVRESTSVWAFPAILSAHAIGMGLAVGVNIALALRLLGVAPDVPPAELKRFVPVMWLGVWMNTASGLLLLIGYPTKALTNPVFYLKLTLIGAGMWLFFVMGRRLFDRSGGLSRGWNTGRLAGAVSLACWAGAVTTGRLLAYTAHRILASW